MFKDKITFHCLAFFFTVIFGFFFFIKKSDKTIEAAEVYERAVSAAKESGDLQVTLYNRIVAYEYAGNFEKARELLTEYLQQYSGDEDAKRELRFLKTR